METYNKFLIDLAHDINMAKKNKNESNQPLSFVTFLGSLTDEKLVMYMNMAGKLLNREVAPTDEEIKKASLFYSLIITEIENEPNDSTVPMDDEGLWALSLFMFLTSEKFYRDGLIFDFSGLLKEGNPTLKPAQKIYDADEDLINSMSPEERKKYNL
jgi:hypothetical protein